MKLRVLSIYIPLPLLLMKPYYVNLSKKAGSSNPCHLDLYITYLSTCELSQKSSEKKIIKPPIKECYAYVCTQGKRNTGLSKDSSYNLPIS